MKNKREFNPILRVFVFLAGLVLLAGAAAICLHYYLFSIPEPEGLSLASWPNRFTENFSLWMDIGDGKVKIEDIGLERLDEYGLWLQVIDETGCEVFSHNKPDDYPTSYLASELMAFGTSGYNNKDTIFASSFEKSGEVFNYLIGFPYAVGKYMLYYNGETVGRLSPVFRSVVFVVFSSVTAAFFVYGFWITRQMGKITRGIGNVLHSTYRPLKEKGIFKSIYTALNKMDTEIKRSNQLKEDTERARREWIANITHDLKTPLSPVKGYAELLADGSVTESQAIQEYGSIILKNVDHTEKLVDDLKLTYQLEAGVFPFAHQQIKMVRYLKELVIDIANDPSFHNRDIEFESNLAEFTAVIDPSLFRRAVQNLIINALVHNPADTKVIIAVTAKQETCVRISIRDNGLGMSEEEQAGLFTRYYRGTNTRENPEGCGLGLAIAKQIIELHGGEIIVRSRTGEGSVFTILLPLGNGMDGN